MAHAQICPVCNGKGKLKDGSKCHGCGGKGWITIQDNDKNNPWLWEDDEKKKLGFGTRKKGWREYFEY